MFKPLNRLPPLTTRPFQSGWQSLLPKWACFYLSDLSMLTLYSVLTMFWSKTCDQQDRVSLIWAGRKRLGQECMWRIHVRAVSPSQCSAVSATHIETPKIEFHIQDQEKAFLSLNTQWASLPGFMWYYLILFSVTGDDVAKKSLNRIVYCLWMMQLQPCKFYLTQFHCENHVGFQWDNAWNCL